MGAGKDLQQFGQVTILVLSYTLEKGSLKNYASYEIQGKDATGEFACKRRYKEFEKLRIHMRRKWLGLYVPLLPEKKAMVRNYAGQLGPSIHRHSSQNVGVLLSKSG